MTSFSNPDISATNSQARKGTAMLKSSTTQKVAFSIMTAGLLGLGAPAFAQTAAAPAAQAADIESQLARDLTIAQKPLYDLAAGASTIDIESWVDKPSLTYQVGQPLRVMVRPKQDAFITVVNVGSSGRVAVLYPNHFQRDAKVRANSIVMIPADRASWHINVSGPAGVDLIKVFASREPLSLPELEQLVRASEANPLITLGRSAVEFVRDLVAQLKPGTQQAIGMRNLLIRVIDKAGTINSAVAAAASVAGVPATAGPASYGLSVRSDRPAYRVGEAVQLSVSTTRDCRLTLISVGASGNAVQLFPNTAQRDNLVRAGQAVLVPPPQSQLQIVARAPAGVEAIMAVCREAASPVPALADASQGGFSALGTLQTIGRDLVAGAAGQDAAKQEHSSTSYLIVE
jgi:hypothetical protein